MCFAHEPYYDRTLLHSLLRIFDLEYPPLRRAMEE